MRPYAGETRSYALRARLVALGFGVVVVRRRVLKANIAAWRWRWFYENGAFLDFRAGVPFDDSAFVEDCLDMAAMPEDHRPAFVTLPDIVAGGLPSLALSMSWLWAMSGLPLRWALVVQDGMTPEDIPWDAPFDVIFVGGSTAWKLATMALWAREAHAHDRTCHVGRISSAKRLRMADTAGVDSGDTAAILFAERNLAPYLRTLDAPAQAAWDFDGMQAVATPAVGGATPARFGAKRRKPPRPTTQAGLDFNGAAAITRSRS